MSHFPDDDPENTGPATVDLKRTSS